MNKTEIIKMKCGHPVYNYELMKSGEVVFIRWECRKKCWTKWGRVGEAPYPDELDME